MNVMALGNMKANIEFDQDTEFFRGEILGLTGSADFYGKTVAALKQWEECFFKKRRLAKAERCRGKGRMIGSSGLLSFKGVSPAWLRRQCRQPASSPGEL